MRLSSVAPAVVHFQSDVCNNISGIRTPSDQPPNTRSSIETAMGALIRRGTIAYVKIRVTCRMFTVIYPHDDIDASYLAFLVAKSTAELISQPTAAECIDFEQMSWTE